jgi:hypothetical protein
MGNDYVFLSYYSIYRKVHIRFIEVRLSQKIFMFKFNVLYRVVIIQKMYTIYKTS